MRFWCIVIAWASASIKKTEILSQYMTHFSISVYIWWPTNCNIQQTRFQPHKRATWTLSPFWSIPNLSFVILSGYHFCLFSALSSSVTFCSVLSFLHTTGPHPSKTTHPSILFVSMVTALPALIYFKQDYISAYGLSLWPSQTSEVIQRLNRFVSFSAHYQIDSFYNKGIGGKQRDLMSLAALSLRNISLQWECWLSTFNTGADVNLRISILSEQPMKQGHIKPLWQWADWERETFIVS